MNHSNNPKYLGVIQSLFMLIVVSMVVWFFYYTHTAVPHGDDFCYGIKVNEHGLFGAVWNEYQHWGGRFTSAMLIGLVMQSASFITHYAWVAPLFILITLGLSVRLFLVYVGIASIPVTIIMYVTIIASINWWESLLWVTGGITYGLSFALLIFLLGIEITYFVSKRERSPVAIQWALYGILSILLAGFNEVVAVFHVVFLGLCLITVLYRQSDKIATSILLWLFSCALLGLLIVNFAPGNAVRMGFLSQQMIVASLIKSFFLFFDQCLVPILISTLLFMSVLHLFRVSNLQLALISTRSLVMIPLLWIIPLAIIAAIFVRIYTSGSMGPLRAQSIDFVLSTIEGFLTALVLLKPSFQLLNNASKRAKDAVGFILALSLLFLFPTPDGKWWYTLRQQYADTRYQEFLQPYLAQSLNQPGTFVTIPRFDTHALKPGQRRPRTIWEGDFTSDTQDWTNQCFAKFYRLRGMQVID